jgi:hypothetical protein
MATYLLHCLTRRSWSLPFTSKAVEQLRIGRGSGLIAYCGRWLHRGALWSRAREGLCAAAGQMSFVTGTAAYWQAVHPREWRGDAIAAARESCSSSEVEDRWSRCH